MRAKGREQGRFVALSGFRKMVVPPGGRYELLIVDHTGRPVSPLCEWYRLRKQPGPNSTRRTYLYVTWNTTHQLGRLFTSVCYCLNTR